MSITKTSRGFVAVAIAPLLLSVSGCAATQSTAFRHLSAAEHERAAQASPGPDGASPAEHLAAAAQLRNGELAACADVPQEERVQGPFAHRERIVAVEEVRDRAFPKWPTQPFGVAVYIRATPGLTAQWIGQELMCSVAHHAAVGAQLSADSSPLTTEDAKISVSTTTTGFRVSFTSSDIDTARRLIAKGRALVANAS
jgi:hypothetical protein